MKKICQFLLLASVIQPAVADDLQSGMTAARHETAGFGIGALLGGLIAGPPGVAIGAVSGALYGHRSGKKEDKLTALEQQLEDRQIDLAQLRTEFDRAQAEHAGNLRKVAAENKRATLDKLAGGISFPVYFRTNEAHIDSTLAPHFQDLVNLIRDIPEIKVLVEAHADERGLPSYNLQLSRVRAKAVQTELIKAGLSGNRIIQHAYGETRARAGNGGIENYIFDRRADVRLTLDTEV